MEKHIIFRPLIMDLKGKDIPIAISIIRHKCKWSAQLFGMKADGLRPLTDGNSKRSKSRINEFHVVETTILALGGKSLELLTI